MIAPNVIGKPNDNRSLLSPICLPQARGYIFIFPHDVEYFEADDNYTWVYTTQHPGKRMISVALHRVDETLEGDFFCRIHRSYIVGISHISEMDPDKTSVRVNCGAWLPIGRSYRKRFFDRLNFCRKK